MQRTMQAAMPLLIAISLSACGGSALKDARNVVEYGARAGASADAALALRYARSAEEALEESKTKAEYRKKMWKLDAASMALKSLRESLLAVEAGLDSWERTDNDKDFIAAAGCLAAATSKAIAALDAAGVSIPPDMQKTLEVISRFSIGACGGYSK